MKNVKLLRYGFIQPNDYTCVPAATRIILYGLGIRGSVKSIAREMKTARGGTTEHALIRYLKKRSIRFTVKRKSNLKDIKIRLAGGRILLTSYWIPFYREYHVAIVKKITAKRIYFHDTWFGSNHNYSLNYFKKNWKKDSCWLLTIRKQ